jgi:hypothetical protein
MVEKDREDHEDWGRCEPAAMARAPREPGAPRSGLPLMDLTRHTSALFIGVGMW